MDFTAEEDFPCLMIFIDFQKAFDTIERCLESFNFGPEFIRWVRTFNNNIQSCVINNGITSDYFTLERGVRQGDPLSSYLFVVAVETLAIAVRQNTSIKGITIGKDETKLLQYADDTTAVLSDVNSARMLFKLLDDFKKLSGLAINSLRQLFGHLDNRISNTVIWLSFLGSLYENLVAQHSSAHQFPSHSKLLPNPKVKHLWLG